MKIYTKTGDKGETGLISGKRVKKSHIRIEAYGTVDELNSWMGVIRDHAPEEFCAELVEIQNELFTIGSQLANDPDKLISTLPDISEKCIQRLEVRMDEFNLSLPEMRNFVLPGGNPLVSFTHLGRCVCRRAERRMVDLGEESKVNETLIRYMNRLSDYLFVLSRVFSKIKNVEEVPWKS